MPAHKKKYYDVVTTFPNYDLHGAAAAGNIGLVTYAITHGQPINAVLGGLLPLHAAASGGSVDVVQLLIDHGADVNAPRMPSATGPPIGVGGAGSIVGPNGIVGGGNDCGNNNSHRDPTASSAGEKLHRGRLGSAGGHHHPPSSSASARPGSANPQSTIPIGRRGSTPLHFAAALGHMDVIRLLLENGARPSAKDADKATPEMVARAAGRTRAAELLKEWEAHLQAMGTTGNGTGTPRRSLENPQQQLATPVNGKPSGAVSPDLRFASENASTASLPLVPSPPAALSTSSLGRYPNQPGRRPSLPSIYESPPSTSYPRPGSSKRQESEPATTKSSNSKLPFSLRRPKSAGNKDKDGGRADDDASSQISHFSSKTTDSKGGASRLNRMFKRPNNNANARPATASGALSTTSSPTSPSPPVVGRSRSPSASKISEKGERSGGFFHGAHLPHLPHLPRRDHSHAYQQSPHHLHPHHVSRDAISGPISNGQSPSTGIPDIAHPEMSEPPLTSSTNYTNSPMYGDVNTPSDELEEEDAMSKMLNLTPAEIQYARTRGALSDRLKSPTTTTRTAPPGQTSFGKKPSYSTLNHYPSHSGLSAKAAASYSTVPSPKVVPRHRQHLGPGGGLTMTNAEQGSHDEFGHPTPPPKPSRTDTPVSYNSSTAAVDKLSPGARVAHPVPSLTSLNRQVRNMRAREGNGSISSLDSALTGTSGSQEMTRSPLGGVDRDDIDYPSHTSPGGQDSPYYGAVGMLPLSDGRLISSRAQASELVEAHKKAIQISHDQRARTRKATGTSSRHGHASPLSDAPYTEPPEQIAPAATADANSSPNHDTEDGNTSFEEEDVTSLREKLAALGETLQIERQLAKREQQARRWNRESALDDGNGEDIRPGEMTIGAGGGGFGPASSMGASVLARNEMLDEYLRTGEQPSASESERVKKRVAAAPVRDVFGRPVTPKQKEGRPPTPKETRPTTPKNVPATPVSSRYQDAPRENRVLPPASKTPPVRSATHLTLQQTRAISKSDLALGSHVNKDAIIRDMDLQGRERAWTTTEVRPRAGPASVSRPSTAGSRPAGTGGGLKIEITQTMATPTDGNTPLKGNSPMEPSPKEQPEQDTIQSRRRTTSHPLRIDAQAAQERSRSKESSEGGPQPSPNTQGEDRRQRSGSKPRRAATPTKDQPSTSSRRINQSPGSGAPAIAVVPPSENPGFASFLSVSSGAQESPVENSSQPVSPVPPLPSALALHHQLMRNHEEALKLAENSARQASPSPPSISHGGDHMGGQISAAERRLGLGVTGRNEFGHDSVRSFNEEKPADGPQRLWSTESRESDTSANKSSAKTKITGLFSRLKR